jgi:hypothetical protein
MLICITEMPFCITKIPICILQRKVQIPNNNKVVYRTAKSTISRLKMPHPTTQMISWVTFERADKQNDMTG